MHHGIDRAQACTRFHEKRVFRIVVSCLFHVCSAALQLICSFQLELEAVLEWARMLRLPSDQVNDDPKNFVQEITPFIDPDRESVG
jgi:hypothetical protein